MCREDSETLSGFDERRIAGDRRSLEDENDCAGELASLIGDRNGNWKCARDCCLLLSLGRSVTVGLRLWGITGGAGAAWLGGGGGMGIYSLGLADAGYIAECGDVELTEGDIILICELTDTVFSLLDSKVKLRPPLEIRMTS